MVWVHRTPPAWPESRALPPTHDRETGLPCGRLRQVRAAPNRSRRLPAVFQHTFAPLETHPTPPVSYATDVWEWARDRATLRRPCANCALNRLAAGSARRRNRCATRTNRFGLHITRDKFRAACFRRRARDGIGRVHE